MPYDRTLSRRALLRVYCLPEEPLRNACVPRLSVTDNLVFRRFDRPPLARGGWWLQRTASARVAHDLIARYRIATPFPQTPKPMAAILILKRNTQHHTSGQAFPGSAGVSPAPEAAKMAALPGGSGTAMTRDYSCLPRK